MEAATYTGIGLILLESIWRLSSCDAVEIIQNLRISSFVSSLYFTIAYILCMLTIFFEVKVYLKKHVYLRNMLSMIHGLDSIVALLVGYAIHIQSNLLLSIAILAITKFFLIHLLARMVTGEVSHSNFDIALQTTKTYVHHIGSFLFLSPEPYTILCTSLWRFTSMNGHAVFAYREYFKPHAFEMLMWYVSHTRNMAVIGIFTVCYFYPTIRQGFGVSAIGHMAYLIVRIGPVFRLGSIYIPEGEEKIKYQKSSDTHKLAQVLTGKYPFLTLELGLMAVLIVYLMFLRSVTHISIDTNKCVFY